MSRWTAIIRITRLVGAEVPDDAVLADEEALLWTLPVGYYEMTGPEAVWYARTRKNSTDFDRGRRQQRLIRAIFRKALDSGQVSQLPSLWSQGMEVVETNMTLNEALSLLPIALSLDTSDIESFTLIPTYHTTSWTTPDGSNVQLPNTRRWLITSRTFTPHHRAIGWPCAARRCACLQRDDRAGLRPRGGGRAARGRL